MTSSKTPPTKSENKELRRQKRFCALWLPAAAHFSFCTLRSGRPRRLFPSNFDQSPLVHWEKELIKPIFVGYYPVQQTLLNWIYSELDCFQMVSHKPTKAQDKSDCIDNPVNPINPVLETDDLTPWSISTFGWTHWIGLT